MPPQGVAGNFPKCRRKWRPIKFFTEVWPCKALLSFPLTKAKHPLLSFVKRKEKRVLLISIVCFLCDLLIKKRSSVRIYGHDKRRNEICNEAYACAYYCQNEYQTKNRGINVKVFSKTAANAEKLFVCS